MVLCGVPLFVGGHALANPCALPLRITEVHVDGLEDPGSEWFELTNAGSVPIDLSAWSFTDQATQGAATEGAVRFDAGMTLAAFSSVVIAYDGAQFQAERGRLPDYEYGVDSAAQVPYLARTSDWSSGRTLSLANSADELLLVCGLVLRDAVRWGIASDERLAAPSPAYSDAAPQNGPRTFERQSVDPWPTAAVGWVSSRCVSPAVAPNPDRAPAVQPTRVLVPYGTTVELDLPGRDPDTAQPTFQLDTAGLSGTLTPLPDGRVRYTPPVTAVPLTTSFRFTVNDGCSTTHRERVEIHVGPPACDPAQAELLLTEVAPGTDDAETGHTLAWVELANPTAEEIDLTNLALGHGALSENGLPQASAGGLVLFPPGAILEPGERLVVAYAAGAFRAALGLEGPILFDLFEWYRDSDLIPNELPLDPRGGRAIVDLPRDNGRAVLYGCDGALVDSLVWGETPPGGVGPLWPAAPPALPGPEDDTPLSYARRSLVDTDQASDWFVARCPTPGAAHVGMAPFATPASYPRADLSALSASFSATDADSQVLSYRGWASAGTLSVASDGAFTFTPPAPGRYILIFEASDGCLADQARVDVCVQTTEVPGNAEDEDCDGLAQCWVDEDGDGFGGALIGVAPGLGCGGPGLSAVGGDCDDDPGLCGEACFPGADELCDGFDNDCAIATADGADDPRVGSSCDSDDANLCQDDVTLCDEGAVVCADDPAGDSNRVEVCDPQNVDEDCDGAADDLDPQGAQGKVETYLDADEDGYGAGAAVLRCDPGSRVSIAGDCDDDPGQCGSFCSPGLTESRLANTCGDGFDNDCDGTTDLDDPCFLPITCYLDLDGDGFGRATGAVTVTGPAAGQGCAAYTSPPYAAGSFVAVSGDCDDDPAVCGAACRPGLAELCDGFDNDCQPGTADGSADARVGASCDSPFDLDQCADDTAVCQSGQIACPNDPDGDAGRIEVCDPLDFDEDCDGGADDADPDGAAGRVTFYRDEDGDGRGGEAVSRCDLGPGFVAEGGDCDDDPTRCGAACRPGLSEGRGADNCADAFDNDCDGQTDSDPECFSLVLCYLDRDRDTFGDFSTERLLTGQDAASGCAGYDDGVNPVGAWVGNGLDCDDDPALCGAGCYPGATELCDGIDNDCAAASADGSGDGLVGAACDGPDSNACEDDRRACVSGALTCVDVPGGDEGRVEVCDPEGVDEDCDGGADDLDPDGPPVNAPTFYRDLDGDSFGDASAPVRACVAPAGTAVNALDCDDDPENCGADCHPGQAELCDGRDNDCDRDTLDGSDDPDVGASCDAAADMNLCEDDVGACVGGSLACVDVTAGDESRIEVCDLAQPPSDEDCDGFANDLDPGGAEGKTLFYRDRDEDGAGDPADTVMACAEPAGYVAVGGDCDDDPAGCGAACAPGLDETAASGRCGDGLDNDCDGQTDRGPSCAAATCFLDKDGDDHGDPAVSTSLPLEALAAGCAAYDDGNNPVGSWVASGDDCDDLDEDVHPGADEVADNEVDEDCDGQIACFTDMDGDGFGTEPMVLAPVTGCGEGLTARGGDCDDRPSDCGAACSPGVPELCDQLDNDCDGQTDEGCDRPGVLGGGSGCSGGPSTWGLQALLWLFGAFVFARRRFR